MRRRTNLSPGGVLIRRPSFPAGRAVAQARTCASSEGRIALRSGPPETIRQRQSREGAMIARTSVPVRVALTTFPVVLATLMGCATRCVVGQQVTIPSSDTTDPAIVIDFHLPGGQIVSATPTSAPPRVIAPTSGTVTLIAKASDPQGVRDIQLFVGTK